ncbi:MAG: hypothetical protein L6416_03140, partial [Candidatus Omnitrophica bacterium]|nr:hypothetical protein [Candidatus Omnitrophota bacterium]
VICPKGAYCLELKSQAEDFIRQERFGDLLDFLDILKMEKKQDISDLQIEYYSVLAKSKYLDYLEKKEDWENYYNHVDLFNAEIIKSAKDFVENHPASLETIDMQYLAWKAIIRDEETASAEQVFNKLIDLVIAYTEENGDTAVFQEIAHRISDAGRVRQLNKLFDSYKEFLSANAGSDSIERLGVIAEEYLEKDNIETAIVIYKHYIDLALRQYPQAKAQLVLNKLANKFRHHGFIPAKDAVFAEKIYDLITQKLGKDALSEEDLFARGYNLESLNICDRAEEEYKYFTKKFPDSVYLPEVYTRIAVINLYSFGRLGISLQFFQKVSEEFPGSFYAPFCTYNAAMLLQWKSEDELASRFYCVLIASGGFFSEAAKERLNEIKNKEKLNEDLRYVLNNLSGTEESSTIMMTLQSRPQRAFVDEQVIWSATAQDFSSGTVQPSFTYEWSGDTGSNVDPGNIAEFSTTYNKAIPQVACFSALVAQTQGVICKALWVHELSVKTPNNIMSFKVGEPVELTAEVFPHSIEDKYMLWQWKTGPEAIDVKGNKLLYSYDVPGNYEIELVADMQDLKIFKKFNVDIVE